MTGGKPPRGFKWTDCPTSMLEGSEWSFNPPKGTPSNVSSNSNSWRRIMKPNMKPFSQDLIWPKQLGPYQSSFIMTPRLSSDISTGITKPRGNEWKSILTLLRMDEPSICSRIRTSPKARKWACRLIGQSRICRTYDGWSIGTILHSAIPYH